MRFKPLLNWKLTALAVAVALSACGGGDDDDESGTIGLQFTLIDIALSFDAINDVFT